MKLNAWLFEFSESLTSESEDVDDSELDDWSAGNGTVGRCSLPDVTAWYGAVPPVCIVALCCAGLAGHALTVAVLVRKKVFNATNLLLVWLSVAQSLLLCSYAGYVLVSRYWATRLLMPWHVASLMLITDNMTVVSHAVAVWLVVGLVVALSVVRIITLSKYGRMRRKWFTIRKCALLVMCVYVVVPCLCVPSVFSHTVVATNQTALVLNNSLPNETGWRLYSLERSSVYTRDDPLLGALASLTIAVLCKLLPCAIVATVSIMLAFKLNQLQAKAQRVHRGSHKRRRKKQRRYKRTTNLIIAVMMLFLAVEMPQSALQVYVELYGTAHVLACYARLVDLSNTVTVVYSSIMFAIFCLMSEQFRMEFSIMFCGSPYRCWTVAQRKTTSASTAVSVSLHGLRDYALSAHPSRSPSRASCRSVSFHSENSRWMTDGKSSSSLLEVPYIHKSCRRTQTGDGRLNSDTSCSLRLGGRLSNSSAEGTAQMSCSSAPVLRRVGSQSTRCTALTINKALSQAKMRIDQAANCSVSKVNVEVHIQHAESSDL